MRHFLPTKLRLSALGSRIALYPETCPETSILLLSPAQVAAEETILTPRFYTTDFDELEQMFKDAPTEELIACLEVGARDPCVSLTR